MTLRNGLHILIFTAASVVQVAFSATWTEKVPDHIEAVNGTSVTLQVALQNPSSNERPQWYSVGRAAIVSKGSNVFTNICSTCTLSDLTDDKFYLTINPVNFTADDGEWQCRSFSAFPQYLVTELDVKVPPIERPQLNYKHGSQVKVVDSQQHTFTCTVIGTKPAVTIKWFLEDTEQPPVTPTAKPNTDPRLVDTVSILDITTTLANDDAKKVKCQASNVDSVDPVETYVTLIVQVPLSTNPTMSDKNSEGYTSGDIVDVSAAVQHTFTCNATGARPAASIEWYLGSTKQTNDISETPAENPTNSKLSDTTSSWLFTPQWKEHHNKFVKCQANNEANTGYLFMDVKLNLLVGNIKPIIKNYNHDEVVKVTHDRVSSLLCTATGRPEPTIKWHYGNDVRQGEDEPPGDHPLDPDLKHVSSRLTFTPNLDEERKVIKCESDNDAESMPEETRISLEVQVSPSSVSVTPSGSFDIVTINDGEEVTFKCTSAGAKPTSTIKWYIDNEMKTADSETSRHNLKDSRLNDTISTFQLIPDYENHQNKSMKCTANNEATIRDQENIETEKTLNVQVAYDSLTFETYVSGENVTLTAGITLTLDCKASNSHPATDIKWYLEEQDITRDASPKITWNADGRKSTTSTLEFTPRKEMFGKQLYCEGRHVVQAQHDKIALTAIVQYSSEILNDKETTTSADQGQTATLKCIASGYPVPDVKWFTNMNDSLTEFVNRTNRTSLVEARNNTERYIESTLIIRDVQPLEDHKIYTCIAVNMIGNATHNITLEGRREPDPPEDLFELKEMATWENVTIAWKAGYNGGSQQHFVVFYYLSGTNHQNNSGAIQKTQYTIKNLKPETEYEVYVMAQNEIDWSEKSKTITVVTLGKPKSTPIPRGTDNSIGIYAGIGSAILVLMIVALVLLVLILRNRSQGPKYLKESDTRPVSETTFDGVENPAMTYRDANIDGGYSHERESTAKDGNPYLTSADQTFLGKNSESKEAATSFAVYASPNKEKKIQDYKHEETAYANVTKLGTRAEPPFLTNGTDHDASPYANVDEKNAQKKEVDTPYADVQTTETRKGKPAIGGKGKKPQRKGKKTKADQADRPYDDVPDESKQQKISTKDVKPSSQPLENPYEVAAINMQKPKPQDANVEGLTYADLDFKGGAKGKPQKPKPPVKPIDDDAVAYAAVDFGKSGKPN